MAELDLFGLIEVASDILTGVSDFASMVFGPSTSEIWEYYRAAYSGV